MLIRLNKAFTENSIVYIDADTITAIEWIENEYPHTNVYTSHKYGEVFCVKEKPDEVVDLIRFAANVRKEKDGIE